MMRSRLAALRSDSGAAAVSIIFLMAAVILGGVLTTAAISQAQTSAATKTYSAMNAATDERFSAYTGDLSTSDAPSLDSICYPSLATCVSITAVTDTATVRRVTLEAAFGDTGKTLQRVEVLTAERGTHISGFDDLGNPVWVIAPGGSSEFSGYR
jgi:hypothetical protein